MIETLRVQNYKSLKDIEIPLKPLTVLVGPNAAGKSNILDCLRFLSEMVAIPGDRAEPVRKRGGYGDIVWGGQTGSSISVSCRWQPLQAGEGSFDYLLVIRNNPTHTFSIEEEHLSASAPGMELVSWHRGGRNPTLFPDTFGLSEDTSKFDRADKPIERWARGVISGWTFYDFLTQSMRVPRAMGTAERLSSDGSNVAQVLLRLHLKEPDLFREVEELLQAAIPEVEKLFLDDVGGNQVYVAWREKAIPGRIPAWNMSEGSVRLVGILLALLVPEPPPLVAFENPEVHLHSHQMEYLAEILKAASRRSQVIITTHSPYLLKHFAPEDVLIVWKEKGQTRVKPVRTFKGLREALKTLDLGEIYYAGHLGGVP